MTLHKTRKRRASGSTTGGFVSPRIAVSLPDVDMALVTWWASVRGIPAAQVIRDAVWAYVAPFRNNPQLKKQYGSEP